VVFLYAVAFLSLGLLNLTIDRNWWRGQRLRLAIGLPLVMAYVYFEMPPLVFPQAFTLLLLTLVPNAAYSALLAARTVMVSRRIVSIRRTPIRPYLIVLAVFLAFAGVLFLAPYVDASGLRDIAQVTTSTSLPPSTDIRNVRVVPQEAAIFAGSKVVGQLGAYYRVGDFSVQVASGRLVWVAPLEFNGVVQWLSRRTSPGVIVVSAENPELRRNCERGRRCAIFPRPCSTTTSTVMSIFGTAPNEFWRRPSNSTMQAIHNTSAPWAGPPSVGAAPA
jgi:hypothetical protein